MKVAEKSENTKLLRKGWELNPQGAYRPRRFSGPLPSPVGLPFQMVRGTGLEPALASRSTKRLCHLGYPRMTGKLVRAEGFEPSSTWI